MKVLTFLLSSVILLQLAATGKFVPQKQQAYVPTCADYRMWYEMAREREYDSARNQYRFADLQVTTYPDRKQLNPSELMSLIDAHRKELGIDTIALSQVRNVHSDLRTLLYPQYASEYTLTKEEWVEIQRRARTNLASEGKFAAPEVIAHWQSIADGHPPFEDYLLDESRYGGVE